MNVVLSAEVSGINTATQDLSVFWDLGDGNTSDSLSVAHTYQIAGRFPISVQIESESLTEPLQNTRFLDVFSTATPTPTPTATPDNGNGDGSGGVCGIGATAAIWMGAMLLIWRRLVR
ncbi:MAG: PKD domain-containing protein [Phycisphaerales bacterium]|nr:PKD domain-containing protein [Phycisphaerales bacterium]